MEKGVSYRALKSEARTQDGCGDEIRSSQAVEHSVDDGTVVMSKLGRNLGGRESREFPAKNSSQGGSCDSECQYT